MRNALVLAATATVMLVALVALESLDLATQDSAAVGFVAGVVGAAVIISGGPKH